ncbi:MAG: methylisocitrate lyase [Pirellulales bacterium]
MTPVSPARALREAVSAGEFLAIPGAPCALAGRLIEEAGFPAVYLSGAALSAGVLALPDIGLVTLSELAQQTGYLTQQVDIPVIVDADTGFGEALHVERTVWELERAGAAAIQLEDQQLPKRCGHLSGKSLVETSVMAAKLRAAVAARTDPDLVVIARTDARDAEGIDRAIDRAKAYLDAGADWIFPEAMLNRDDFKQFAQAIDAPLLANMTEFGKSPLIARDELRELGYAAVLYPVTLLRIAMKAMETLLAVLRTEGTQVEMLDLMQTREELYELIGYHDYEARDRAFFASR